MRLLRGAQDRQRARGLPAWRDFDPAAIAADISRGDVYLAKAQGRAEGTVTLVERDETSIWSADEGRALYLHRLASAAPGAGALLIRWARSLAAWRCKNRVRLETWQENRRCATTTSGRASGTCATSTSRPTARCRRTTVERSRPSTRSSSERASIRRLGAVQGVELFGATFRRFAYARHSHDSLAFGGVEQGAMRFWHGGGEYLASAGEMIVLNPGEVHDGRTDPSAGCRYHMLYVEQPAIEELFAADEPRLRSGAALKGPLVRDRALAKLISDFSVGNLDSLQQQTALAVILFQLFTRHGRPPLAARPVAAEKNCVARAKSYMAESLDRPLLLKDIAAAAGLSNWHFLRTFKRVTGMPPHAYLNQLRLERARGFLAAGEAPAQVAAALGFSDQSHLIRRFKAAFGFTPGQYRR